MRNLAIRVLDTTLACWISTLLFVGGGCSTDHVASQVASMNDANIKRVSNLYYAYQRSHGWQGPKDEMALKQFIKHDMDPKKLGLMNVDPANLDELFVSQRDHQPFKIRYGVGGGPGANVAVAFEENGVDGQREVGFTGPMVKDVDQSQYKELWEGKATAK